MTAQVNALARTTGTAIVPEGKVVRGYRFEKDKFGIAGLTPEASECIRPARVKECPVQMEAELCREHRLLSHTFPEDAGLPHAIEVKILKTYVTEELRLAGHTNRIDSDKWRPMIMSFQNLYGLKGGQRAESTLAGIDEELYRVFGS